jgi:hypothetical protein
LRKISTGSPQDLLKDLYEITQGHIKDFTRTSSRASHKDLRKIMLRPLTAAFHWIHGK